MRSCRRRMLALPVGRTSPPDRGTVSRSSFNMPTYANQFLASLVIRTPPLINTAAFSPVYRGMKRDFQPFSTACSNLLET